MLMITYQAEGIPGEVWDHALSLKDAKLADGRRGQLIMIRPLGLPDVKIQVFLGGRITIWTPDLYMLGKTLAYLQEHLKIWRTPAAKVDPVHARDTGSRAVVDPATHFTSPAPNAIEEWRTSEETPGKLVPKFVMTWKQITLP